MKVASTLFYWSARTFALSKFCDHVPDDYSKYKEGIFIPKD